MKDLKTQINEIIYGKSEHTVKQIFESCLKTYRKPRPRFMYSMDGLLGEEFEADDIDSAWREVAEKSGISVWEVEDV